MLFAFGWFELVEVVLEDFRGGLDDAQRRAELVRHHGNEIAPQLPQLLFSGKRPEQFGLGLLALRDIKTDNEHMRFAIDFDDVG